MRPRPAPYGGLTHPTTRFKIQTSLTSPSAEYGTMVAKCLTMMCLILELLCCGLVLDTTKLSPCLNTETPDSVEWDRQSEQIPMIQNCISSLALIVFPWHLDHNGATRFAVQMSSTGVVEHQNSHVSKLWLPSSID